MHCEHMATGFAESANTAATLGNRDPQSAALRACEGALSGRLTPASAVIATASGCSSGSAALAPSAACAC